MPTQTRYFRVFDTDATDLRLNSDEWEVVANVSGKWVGVAKTDDEKLIAKMVARQLMELTQADYEDSLKKKAELPSSWESFRPVAGTLGAPPAAKAPVAPSVSPPVEVRAEQVIAPAAVPPRRRSAVAAATK